MSSAQTGQRQRHKPLPAWLNVAEEADPSDPSASRDDEQQDEGDDYLSMSFAAETESSLLSKCEKDTIQRHERGRTRAPAEIAAEKRQEALNKSLFEAQAVETKAMRMMRMMGYSKGSGLGVSGTGAIEPIAPDLKGDRTGVGRNAAQKRKIQDMASMHEKRQKVETDAFRKEVRTQHETKQLEGQLVGAQKVCETLDTRRDEDDTGRQVNVLWRGLVLERVTVEREKRMRQQMMDGLSVRAREEYDKPELNAVEEDAEDEEDLDLEEFNQLDVADRLQLVLAYLRREHLYCFWCGCKYRDADDLAEHCPGLLAEDH